MFEMIRKFEGEIIKVLKNGYLVWLDEVDNDCLLELIIFFEELEEKDKNRLVGDKFLCYDDPYVDQYIVEFIDPKPISIMERRWLEQKEKVDRIVRMLND